MARSLADWVQRYWEHGNKKVRMLHEECPLCGGPIVYKCRCLRADRLCINGCWTHNCLDHELPRLVRGQADHTRPSYECSCEGRGDAEVAVDPEATEEYLG